MANGFKPRDYEGFEETLALLVRAGCPKNGPGADSAWEIVKAIHQYGMTPEQIATHYITLVKRSFGGDWQKANRGHGANWRFTKAKAADLKRGIGIGDIAW